jgi:hypothetical protein
MNGLFLCSENRLTGTDARKRISRYTRRYTGASRCNALPPQLALVSSCPGTEADSWCFHGFEGTTEHKKPDLRKIPKINVPNLGAEKQIAGH